MRRHPWIFSGAIDHIKAEDESEITEGALVEIYTRTGDFIALGHIRSARSLCVCLHSTRNRSTRPGGTGASPWPTRRTAHAWTHGQPRHGLLPPRPRRRRRAAGARGGHLRHGGRRPVPLRRHVPRPSGYCAGDPGCLRRPHHGHLRQKFANRALQRQAGCRGRIPVGELRPFGARGDGERREIPRQLGSRGRKPGSSSTSAKTGAGQTLLEGAHGAQHLLLHGGFSVYAMAGGAEKVCSVDSSERAVVLATENMKLNFGPQANFTETAADAVEYLKRHRRQIRPDHPRPAGLRQAPQGAG